MRIAVISDSHDNIAGLEAALAAIRTARADVLLHCGDLCAPFMVDKMAAGFGGPIHIVFGNNDGDGRLLQVKASAHAHVTLHGIYYEDNLDGCPVAMIHYPEPARPIARSGLYRLVCYGHDHIKYADLVGDAWLVNPGELLGMRGPATWGLYDANAHTFQHYTVQL